MKKITVEDIKKRKGKSKITMLTCYDYSFAKILDASGIDMILVGDSLANVVLGMEETRKLSLSEMINHTKAVVKGSSRTLVVADMPYVSYQRNPKKCVIFASKFINCGAKAVKIEWFKDCEYVVKKLIKNKIPVMGHIGLTPQTAHLLGGYKVQGKDEKRAAELIKQAKLLQDLGVFSLVLECIPYPLAQDITKTLKIPTIGIGAGKYCDGQVLVTYDFLGLYKEKKPKFVRVYKDLSQEITNATSLFIKDVKRGNFPNKLESFSGEKKK
ncbi:MAG: 3-methyl-2-oxobutanoate hydroxymethyltransferase [Candidatus Susulua stagnicola]|nr:3-methyl-2-oxobutanoate hydroxymethyltransferase [Candidatus Susulua stagnicola]